VGQEPLWSWKIGAGRERRHHLKGGGGGDEEEKIHTKANKRRNSGVGSTEREEGVCDHIPTHRMNALKSELPWGS